MIGQHETGPAELALNHQLQKALGLLMERRATAADVAWLIAPAVSAALKTPCRHWHARREGAKTFCVLCGEQL